MMKIIEPIFEIIYLLGGLFLSILILIKSKKRLSFVLFGIMGLILVFGDSFHLIPRMINAWEISVNDIFALLGIGKLITSITMTIFYVILYWFFKIRYQKKTSIFLDISIYVLALARITLCLFPQNEWTLENSSYMWGIYRNIPFVIMGILMVVLTFIWVKEKQDKPFRFVSLAILLSFIFYIMTVTLTVIHKMFGMMMLPKTICYVWILIMGLIATKENERNDK